jgi:phospholipase/carboxylesterase
MRLITINRAATRQNAPVLILLHGIGSDEQDLMGLAPEVEVDVELVSVRAPHLSGYRGYSWFDFEIEPDGGRTVDGQQALESRDAVIELLDDFSDRKIIVGGFSQGSMIATGVALAQPERISAAWLMSGRWLPQWQRYRYWGHLPMLVQHGLYDEVLSIGEGRALADKLRDCGQDVTWREYPMGHQVSQASLRDANEWLRKQCY